MLAELIVLPPFLAAALLAAGIVSGRIAGESSERATSRIALFAVTLSCLATFLAVALKLTSTLPDHIVLGRWLSSGTYRINLSFSFDALSLTMASLVAVLSVLVLRFSVNYMHRESGFHRFFLVLSLFVGAMLLLVTAGNAALTFVGWELAGVSSYLLIAYAYDRPVAAGNATRAFVTNRIGDAGFVLGIFLAFFWTGGIDWPTIMAGTAPLPEWQAGLLACAFLLAAIAKSAQVPLAPWLARAIEGPTPSSAIFYGAVMVHAGVYLVLRLESVFDQAPVVMALMAASGLLTAIYGFVCGLTQTDVKSALIFATLGQVGLMFLEAGLGFWNLALWHLCAHAVFRGYQFLTAPSLMHQIVGSPARALPERLARQHGLYLASLQRFWLEELGDRLVVTPIRRLGGDLQAFDSRIIEKAFGEPTADDRDVTRASGLTGRLVWRLALALHWFEYRLVLGGLGQELLDAGRRLGVRLNTVEELLNRPRYLVAFILATLLTVF